MAFRNSLSLLLLVLTGGMEKYKRFTDAATGINPFVPLPRPSSVVATTVALVVAPLATLIGLLFLAVQVLLDELFVVFHAMFLGPVFGPLLYAPLTALCTRVCLLCFAHAFLRRHCYPPRAAVGRQDEPTAPAAGDVVFVNCQSALDALTAQAAFPARPLLFAAPHFATADGPHVGVWSTRSKVAAMAWILRRAAPPAVVKIDDAKVDFTATQAAAKKAGLVVAAFAEGATSNGKGVLRLPQVLCAGAVHVAPATYANGAHTAPVPGQLGWLRALLRASANAVFSPTGNRVDVTLLRPSMLPYVPTLHTAEWTAALQGKLCCAPHGVYRGDRKALGASSALDKPGFLELWDSYNKAA